MSRDLKGIINDDKSFEPCIYVAGSESDRFIPVPVPLSLQRVKWHISLLGVVVLHIDQVSHRTSFT